MEQQAQQEAQPETVDLHAIERARERLAAWLEPSPLALSSALTRLAGRKVWLKFETQQPTGSFKIRPALNGALMHLEQAKTRGILASSSGNFAQAVAYAARELRLDAEIVMMGNSSPYKIKKTEEWGAKVVLCGNTFQARWETTYRIQRESGRLLLHPYDSPETIAGDGVIGLELLDQVAGEFTVLAPASGGGLVSGIATALKLSRPACRVFAVQPEVNGSIRRSLEAGKPVQTGPFTTIADALVASKPGEKTFEIIRERVAGAILVSEDKIVEAVRWLASEQKVIAEPGGAVAVAALLDGFRPDGKQDVVCVISGGNILPAALAKILADG